MMDNDILKLLPQKAFKLISIRETLKIGSILTKSLVDKKNYDLNVQERINSWKIEDIEISQSITDRATRIVSKEDGEKILKIYFAQFFDRQKSVHLDLRASHFSNGNSFKWMPSKLHYTFTPNFLDGVRSLYEGFYFSNDDQFEKGLFLLGILNDQMSDDKKRETIKVFHEHFGEGKDGEVGFSLKKLQDSFNKIFSHFIRENIPLNPEFAVLGAMLATLYLTLEDIAEGLNVKEAFIAVVDKYKK